MARKMQDLIEELNGILDDEKKELVADEALCDTDRLVEIVDGMVPIYYSELAQLLAEDPSLGFLDDVGLIDTNADDFSIFSVIQVAIYERLYAAAQSWLDDAVKEKRCQQEATLRKGWAIGTDPFKRPPSHG